MNNIWGDVSQYDPVVWNWVIAVYLFLAGLSAGSLLVAIAVRKLTNSDQGAIESSITKAAAIIAPVSIMLGMACLVLDLTKPLYFWVILLNYNLESVMSLGVIVLLLYIPLTLVYSVNVFKAELSKLVPKYATVITAISGYRGLLEATLVVLAIMVAAYTGFLISALNSYPMLNTSVLPALFLFSALSAGAAANSLLGLTMFGATTHDDAISVSHRFEVPVVVMEALFLIMLFSTLYFSGGAAALAVSALTEGVWAAVFWIGVVAIGFGIPLASQLLPHESKHRKVVAISVASASLVGVLALRHFVIYAGQSYVF
ncbi:NrfD/PsrC family molybdoenzyme membrane anchor subunit [Paraferrimonas haliotis]|uniref:NrfD/PsrC family molybdoenzyme membrane anchor subunit n=1 Tax=Paraferrimonas haliotis TaxID=2013866 RepID=UPI000BA9AF95|nr:NrfD/PsrC family molybdoenzyme membrane anchor subunit [Paraferrimonas haliotis]